MHTNYGDTTESVSCCFFFFFPSEYFIWLLNFELDKVFETCMFALPGDKCCVFSSQLRLTWSKGENNYVNDW